MKLRKGPVWVTGFVAITAVIIGGFVVNNESVILQGLESMVWLIGLGLGFNVAEAVQRSALFKPELHKEDPK